METLYIYSDILYVRQILCVNLKVLFRHKKAAKKSCGSGGHMRLMQQLFYDFLIYSACEQTGLFFRMLRKEIVIIFMQQLFYLLCQEQNGDDVRDYHERIEHICHVPDEFYLCK